MQEIKELVVTSVNVVTDELANNTYARVTLKQVAGLSVTGSVKFKMEKGQPLIATRLANVNGAGVSSMNVGDIVDGVIMKVATTDYQLRDSDRVVNSFTVAVFDGESAIDLVNSALERQGHKACALNGKGEPTIAFEVAQPKQEEPSTVDAVGEGTDAGAGKP